MVFMIEERQRAERWKTTTSHLPSAAKSPAPYVGKDGRSVGAAHGFCLPAEYADLNLLKDTRAIALDVFAELQIPWHAGVGDGPSNHLLSSQVQCVNALAPAVRDPTRLVSAFGASLGVRQVLQIEPDRSLTFEYIGPRDYFNECPGEQRVRGARCTSLDAAFLHRAADGLSELVLIEWKYTESYRTRVPDPERDEVRRRRYSTALLDPAGPVRDDVLPFDLLLDEPLYQLVRQQLLAHALEQDHAEGADRVRVVHIAPAGNTGYQLSLRRPEHQAVGRTVREVWQRLLRRPDRFVSLDGAMFLDPAVTSEVYARRYGGTDPGDDRS